MFQLLGELVKASKGYRYDHTVHGSGSSEDIDSYHGLYVAENAAERFLVGLDGRKSVDWGFTPSKIVLEVATKGKIVLEVATKGR